ncbi:uncharacterized protein DS421_18g622090 [Arachis hypogaea]|nr:uncharacterized protein DS421_18g622090 [Arachis hypogaea]
MEDVRFENLEERRREGRKSERRRREEPGRGVTEFRGDGSSVQWRFGATAAQGKMAVQG